MEQTDKIVLNANELTIHTGTVLLNDEEYTATEITLDKERETATYQFDRQFAQGSTLQFTTSFTGIHNDQMAGFYRSGYIDKDNNKKWMLATQFESTDCRRAFPSFDEPNLKSTFKVILNCESHLTALSNMNVDEENTVQIDGLSMKSTTFATTPLMSTYLVAFVVGEIEFIETTATPKLPLDAKPITVRVYTTIGDVEQGRFGLEVAARTLEYFSEYFDYAYPLPKMDLIAIPDFSAGAMENWGLVTYRTVYLLFDEKNSSSKTKQGVAYVVGHELAHQWFGNLVTMDWWSELWLNEGFATFVGWMAVDNLFPEWDIWTSFVTDEMLSALSLDALRSSHPIQVPVNSPSEITQIFDAISYSKGASVIRMLNTLLTEEKFKFGVQNYLKKFKYTNAKTNDLWDALKEASGIDVASLMKSWTLSMGYPVVQILSETYDDEKKEMTLALSQRRFLSSGDLTAEEDAASPVWWIPLGIVTHSHQSKPLELILTEKTGKVVFAYDASLESPYYKLNFKYTGLFRVQMTDDRLKSLSLQIANDRNAFAVSDRVGLIMDSFSLAMSGYASTTSVLEIIQNYKNEDNYTVLMEMSRQISVIQSAWYQQPSNILELLQKMKRDIFAPKVVDFGYDLVENEDILKSLSRVLVISAAAKSGDSDCIKELSRRFDAFIQGDESALQPNLRGIAYACASKHTSDPKTVFNDLIHIYKTAKASDQKLVALGALGSTASLDIAQTILNEFALTEQVRSQDIMYPLSGLIGEYKDQCVIRPMMWKWVLKNWDFIYKKYLPTPSLLAAILQICIRCNLGEEFIQTIQDWRKSDGLDVQLKTVSAKLDQCLEQVGTLTGWVKRDAKDVNMWLELNCAVQTSKTSELVEEEKTVLLEKDEVIQAVMVEKTEVIAQVAEKQKVEHVDSLIAEFKPLVLDMEKKDAVSDMGDKVEKSVITETSIPVLNTFESTVPTANVMPHIMHQVEEVQKKVTDVVVPQVDRVIEAVIPNAAVPGSCCAKISSKVVEEVEKERKKACLIM